MKTSLTNQKSTTIRYIQRKQAGFGHIAILALVVVVAVTGIIGYKLYANKPSDTAKPAISAVAPNAITKTAAPIKSTSDIDATSKALDAQDPTTSSGADYSTLQNQTKDIQ